MFGNFSPIGKGGTVTTKGQFSAANPTPEPISDQYMWPSRYHRFLKKEETIKEKIWFPAKHIPSSLFKMERGPRCQFGLSPLHAWDLTAFPIREWMWGTIIEVFGGRYVGGICDSPQPMFREPGMHGFLPVCSQGQMTGKSKGNRKFSKGN